MFGCVRLVMASRRSSTSRGKRANDSFDPESRDEVLVRAQIESGLGSIHHSVREEIQKLLDENQVFAAEQKLLEYVVTEDHQGKINAASADRRLKTKSENRRFVIWITIIAVVIIVAYLLMGAPWLWTGRKT